MKKRLMMALCVMLMLSACSDADNKNEKKSDEKKLTCQLEDNEQAGVKVTYTYNEDKKITKIHNVSYLQFTKTELVENSLDDYYEQIKSQYQVAEGEAGVEIKLKKDNKHNRIQLDVMIDIYTYNLEDDILNVTNNGEMDSIDDLVRMYEATDVYSCEKVV